MSPWVPVPNGVAVWMQPHWLGLDEQRPQQESAPSRNPTCFCYPTGGRNRCCEQSSHTVVWLPENPVVSCWQNSPNCPLSGQNPACLPRSLQSEVRPPSRGEMTPIAQLGFSLLDLTSCYHHVHVVGEIKAAIFSGRFSLQTLIFHFYLGEDHCWSLT